MIDYQYNSLKINHKCARRETRTLKEVNPTASETATFANFAIRATMHLSFTADLFSAIYQVPRARFELARFPATPSKWCVYQFRHLGLSCLTRAAKV